jgi:hypothetical protein
VWDARVSTVTAAAWTVATAVACSSTIAPPQASESKPQKPELTEVTTSMLVDRSAIPGSAAMEFTPPSITTDIDVPVDGIDPAECGPLFRGPISKQLGSASWSTSGSPETATEVELFSLSVLVPSERPDLRSLLPKCEIVRYQGVVGNTSPLSLPGAPNWALGTRVSTQGADGAGLIGLVRGLYVSVVFTQKPNGDISPDDTEALVKLFNDQVAKLEAV